MAVNYLCCHFTLIIRLVFRQVEIGKIVRQMIHKHEKV